MMARRRRVSGGRTKTNKKVNAAVAEAPRRSRRTAILGGDLRVTNGRHGFGDGPKCPETAASGGALRTVRGFSHRAHTSVLSSAPQVKDRPISFGGWRLPTSGRREPTDPLPRSPLHGHARPGLSREAGWPSSIEDHLWEDRRLSCIDHNSRCAKQTSSPADRHHPTS
jgi:hypothetical protein